MSGPAASEFDWWWSHHAALLPQNVGLADPDMLAGELASEPFAPDGQVAELLRLQLFKVCRGPRPCK